MNRVEVHNLLEKKYLEFNNSSFIELDPISIPHSFSEKNDIEISAFLTATISWGQRKTIINNSKRIMTFMDHAPYDFIMNHEDSDLKRVLGFVHRTFNDGDLIFFIKSLSNIYENHGGLEKLFTDPILDGGDISNSIENFREVFFSIGHESRTTKHVSSPAKGSAAKRINMFLRWMVRDNKAGVDFGIWNNIPTADLKIPLDVHTASVSRKLGLLHRKMNDWKAVEELSSELSKFDPIDPIKFDFALFGLGAIDGFGK